MGGVIKIFCILNVALLSCFLFVNKVFAASGPIAKGFGADDWLDKIHVVLTVLGLVVFTTLTLVYLILRKK